MKKSFKTRTRVAGLALFLLLSSAGILVAQTPTPTPPDQRGLGIQANAPATTQTNQQKPKEAKPELVLQTGYSSFLGATRLLFSPDGRLLATGTFRSNTIKLWETSTGRELRNLSAGGQSGISLSPVFAFSGDSRFLAAAGANNSVTVWDVTTGREMQTLSAAQTSFASALGVSFLAFSADGKKLVTVSDAIRVWDTTTGREIKSIEASSIGLSGFAGGVGGFALSPDGNQLASASDDGAKTRIMVLDLITGRETRSINLPNGQVNSIELCFTPDGRLFAGGIVEMKLKIWEVTNKPNERELGPTTKDFSVIKFSGDGRLVALCEDYRVKVWEAATGRELPRIDAPNLGLYSEGAGVLVGFTADGKKIAIGGFGSPTVVWETETAKHIVRMAGRSNMSYAVAFSADGNQLVSGGRTRWDLRGGRGVRMIPSPSEKLFGMPSRDGKLLAMFAPNSNSITIVETPSGRALQNLLGPAGFGVNRARFSTDGRLVAAFFLEPPGGRTVASLTSNEVRIWEASTGRLLQTLNVGFAPNDVEFSDDGKSIATMQGLGEVALWDVSSGAKLRNLTSSPTLNPSSIMNPSRPGSMPTMPNMADLNAMVNNMLGTMAAGTMGRSVTSVEFSRDGKVVATGGVESKSNLDLNSMMNPPKNQKGSKKPDDSMDYLKNIKVEASGQVVLWDPTTGTELGRITGHGRAVTSVVFSRDGKFIASSSTDNTIKIWDAATRRELRTLTGHTANIESMDFSPDGLLLASAGEDGGTFLWDTKTGEHLLTLISLDDGGEWMVVTPQGLFDGTPQSWNQILWRYNQDTFNVAPIERYFNEYFHPGLLSDVFAGKRPKVAQDVSKKDRRQPVVKLSVTGPADNIATRKIRVKVDITEAPADADHSRGSGARDVRLFRNGSLVKVWHGDTLKGQATTSLEQEIAVVAGPNNLTAYAFNGDNIKSTDATMIVTGADALKRQGTAHILAVGINTYSNSDYNLKYAVADAQEFAAEVKRQQDLLQRYGQVEITSLSDADATKANITEKLAQIASRAQPEDAVIIYFAGHGTAHGNAFYLIPHDLGYTGSRDSLNEAGVQTILDHSMSDRELEKLFAEIDAGQLVLVIDACNSGQALEAEEKRRGPMNSKGLAQLAYEKGMYVLTAAQSYQAAMEAAKLGHGYLTYALVEEGLKKGAADREPMNRTVELREWLNFATDEVPRMQEQNSLEAMRGRGRSVVFVGDGRELGVPKTETEARDNIQRPRVFYRRELEANPMVVATVAGTSPR